MGEGIQLPAAPGTAGRNGDAVRLGIRPEHFVLRGDAPLSPDAPQLRLRVSAVDSLGSITELHGTVPGTFDTRPWLARIAGRHRANPGDEVVLSWHPAHAHLFDPTSGARLVPTVRHAQAI